MQRERVGARPRRRAADRFGDLTAAAVARLPFGLARVVAPSLLGFVLINSTTFGLDLSVLSVLHGTLRVPLGVAVTCGYVLAFALGYVLNRMLNFRSHADVLPQFAVYVALVVVNYLVLVLGLTMWLTSAGIDFRLARVAAAACEFGYLYVAVRWLVFRDSPPRPARRGRHR